MSSTADIQILLDEPRLNSMHPFGAIITSPSTDLPYTSIAPSRMRDLVAEHGVVALRGFAPPADADELADYGRSWGELLECPFGFVFDVLAHQEPEDHAFDTGFTPMRWDGMYAEFIPQYQIFHCVTAPPSTSGGSTLFCDTRKLLAEADRGTLARWKQVTLQYKNPKLSRYGGHVVSPLIGSHPLTGASVMRFLEPVPESEAILNPPSIRVQGLYGDAEAATLQEICRVVRDPRFVYAHHWQEGDVVVTDNYSVLHTREAYAPGLPHHLRRTHVLGNPAYRSNLRRIDAAA